MVELGYLESCHAKCGPWGLVRNIAFETLPKTGWLGICQQLMCALNFEKPCAVMYLLGWNQSRTFVWYQKRLKKPAAHSAPPFLVRELFLAGQFPLRAEQCGMGWCNTEPSFFSSCGLFAGFLFHCVANISYVDSRTLPELFYSCRAVWLLMFVRGTQKQGSPALPFFCRFYSGAV